MDVTGYHIDFLPRAPSAVGLPGWRVEGDYEGVAREGGMGFKRGVKGLLHLLQLGGAGAEEVLRLPAPNAAVVKLDVSFDTAVRGSVANDFASGHFFVDPGDELKDELLEAAVFGSLMLSDGAEVDGGKRHTS